MARVGSVYPCCYGSAYGLACPSPCALHWCWRSSGRLLAHWIVHRHRSRQPQLPPGSGAVAQIQGATFFPETGFAVGTGPLGDYFASRGGARTFGPPISNEFTLQGATVQIFKRFMLKQDPSGSVAAVNLIDSGEIPARGPSGEALPLADPTLIAAAPVPGTPDYGTKAQDFVRANAPDQWDGRSVSFYQAFLNTVHYDEAFPGGTGDRGLLPGMALEVWGVPVSRPTHDSQNADIVYLRWERGVMVWNATTNTVEAVPLGDVFRAVLTGDGLTPDITAEATGSAYFRQLDASAPNGVARPADLPDSTLSSAFVGASSSITAAAADIPNPSNAQQVPPYYYTPTPTPYGGIQTFGTPTPTPFGYVPPGGVPPQGQTSGFPTVVPGAAPQPGAIPNNTAPSNSGVPAPGTVPGAAPGAIPPPASTTRARTPATATSRSPMRQRSRASAMSC